MALSLRPCEISLDRSASQVPRYALYTQDPRKVYLTRPRNFLLSLDLVHLCCQTIEEVSLKPPPPHLAANLHGARRKRTLLFCSAAGAYVCSVVHVHYVFHFCLVGCSHTMVNSKNSSLCSGSSWKFSWDTIVLDGMSRKETFEHRWDAKHKGFGPQKWMRWFPLGWAGSGYRHHSLAGQHLGGSLRAALDNPTRARHGSFDVSQNVGTT